MATILTCYYRPKPGGFCTRYFRAIRALLARGHTVHYLAVAQFPIAHENCHFHRFPWPSTLASGLLFWGYFHILAPFLLLYLGVRHRISNAFAFGSNYGFVLQLLRVLRPIPLSVFLRADVLKNHALAGRKRWVIGLEQIVERIGVRRACVFGVSKTLTDDVAVRNANVKSSVFAVLTNNVDENPTPKPAPNHCDVIRFSCVGFLEARKNIEVVLHAIALCTSKRIALTVYGDGPYAAALRRQAADLHIEHCVTFGGWVTSAEIWQTTDVLLFPSLHEGFPNTICEALAHRVPIFASDIPEHRELLPTSHLLDNDAKAWAQAIESLCAEEGVFSRVADAQHTHSLAYRFDWDDAVVRAIIECRTPNI